MPGKKNRKTKSSTAVNNSGRVVAENRRARFNYELMEQIEAGLALSGTEIKSIRAGRVSLQEAYAQEKAGQIWLHKMHIAPWVGGGPWNHEPDRPRRLLLHKQQIMDLGLRAGQQGRTLMPMRVYIKGHLAKVELALARGRRRHDKRRVIQQRETEREIARALRRER